MFSSSTVSHLVVHTLSLSCISMYLHVSLVVYPFTTNWWDDSDVTTWLMVTCIACSSRRRAKFISERSLASRISCAIRVDKGHKYIKQYWTIWYYNIDIENQFVSSKLGWWLQTRILSFCRRSGPYLLAQEVDFFALFLVELPPISHDFTASWQSHS